MGVVYWLKIQTRESEQTVDSDLGAVCRASRQLGALSDLLGVPRLTSFTDEAGASAALAGMLGDESDAEYDESDVEHDWHRTSDGLSTVVALCEVLMSNQDALPAPEPPSIDHLLGG